MSFCEGGVFEKTIRVSFKTTTHTIKQTLDYIHSDQWGSFRINSHGEAIYFMSIIDDFARKV